MKKLWFLIMIVLSIGRATAQVQVEVVREEKTKDRIAGIKTLESGYLSVRLMGLGSDFAGLVEDERTDVLFNPARIVRLNENLLSSQFRYKQREVNLTGFFPKFTSGIGVGSYLSGLQYRSSHGTPEEEEMHLSWDRMYVRRSSAHEDQLERDYLVSLLGGYELNSRTSIGFLYTYNPIFTSRTSYSEYLEERWSLVQSDSSQVERYRYGSDEIDRNLHRFRLGFLLSDQTEDWEFFGEYRIAAEDISSSSIDENRYSDVYMYSDTTCHDTTCHYRHSLTRHQRAIIRSDRQERQIDSKVVELGGKYRRRLGDTKLNIYATFGLATEELPEERSASEIYDESSYYFRVSDGDTSTDERETTWNHTQENHVSGDAEVVFGQVGVGIEKRVLTDRLILIAGSVFKLGRRSERTEDRVQFVTDGDLVTSHTNSSKFTELAARLAIPIGVEYTIHPAAVLRFGVTTVGYYEEQRIDSMKLYEESILIGECFGASLSPTPYFSFDIYTLEPASLKSWTMETTLRF